MNAPTNAAAIIASQLPAGTMPCVHRTTPPPTPPTIPSDVSATTPYPPRRTASALNLDDAVGERYWTLVPPRQDRARLCLRSAVATGLASTGTGRSPVRSLFSGVRPAVGWRIQKRFRLSVIGQPAGRRRRDQASL